MRILPFSAFVALLPLSAVANNSIGDLDCSIISSCSNDLKTGVIECEEDSAILQLRKLSGTKYKMGWAGQSTITVYTSRFEGFHLFEGRDAEDAVQTLVVADDLRASLSFAGVNDLFPTALFTFSSLSCEAPGS